MPKVKINPNFGYWVDVNGDGTVTPPKPSPPASNNQLQAINQILAANNFAPAGYSSSFFYNVKNFNINSNTITSIQFPQNLNIEITSITLQFINQTTDYWTFYLQNDKQQSAWVNSTSFAITDECVLSYTLNPNDFIFVNNKLTLYYVLTGVAFNAAAPFTFNMIINYIVFPN